MKRYKTIFFDWDGTAVTSRSAPVDDLVVAMRALLRKGIVLVIISGTTYENIAGGQLHNHFTPCELQYLFLGLGRGALNYRFDSHGLPVVFADRVPQLETLLSIHRVCFETHQLLLRDYGLPTDIVFSRPNYCKIDLMVTHSRGEHLYYEDSELVALNATLNAHGYSEGLAGLISLAKAIGINHGLNLSITSDAKYLEIGLTDKRDNVDTILSTLESEHGIKSADCAFWGDEYVGLGDGIYGSDSFMMTSCSRDGDFFDVSDSEKKRPKGVHAKGGGVATFLRFLESLME